MFKLYIILNIIGLILLLQYFRGSRNRVRANPGVLKRRWRIGLIVSAILILPLLLSRLFFIKPVDNLPDFLWIALVVITAGGISGVWMGYVLSLDLFEKEKWYHILLVFLGACLSTFAVFPLSDMYFELTGHNLNGNPLSDFLYCVIGIGFIEEIVKILPVLLLLRFSKAVNEPYDYLLYASIAALGFAFVENVLYLSQFEHFATNARALYASVAHMTFSSIVAYSMMLSMYKWKTNIAIGLVIGIVLASLAHGFYDFWLINNWASQFAAFSTLFFIASVHLWTVMKNNSMNLSPYFSPMLELRNDWLKSYLIIGLLSIAMFSFLILSLQYGFDRALDFLLKQFFTYGYIILYLVFGLSNYDLIRSYLAPLQVPYRFLIPSFRHKNELIGKRFSFLPAIGIDPVDLSKMSLLHGLKGKVIEKMSYLTDTNWLIVELDDPINIPGYQANRMAIKSRDESPGLENENGTLTRIMLFKTYDGNQNPKAVFAGYLMALPAIVETENLVVPSQ